MKNNFKVVILTAGRGLRLNSLVENINKCLLPIAEKAVISHIIEKFSPEIEFVIAIGYQGEKVVEYISHAHSERKITFVKIDKFEGEGTGPGYSLSLCKKYLRCPFIIFVGDTLIDQEIPTPDKNWLGVHEVSNTERFCSVRIKNGKIIHLDDKKKTNNKFAFIGLAGICDYDLFWDALEKNQELINNEIQISNGLMGLVHLGLYPENFSGGWNDTGTLESYYTTRKLFENNKSNFDKENEFTYCVNGRIVKFFNNKQSISKRCQRAELLYGLTPEIDKQTSWFYSYKFHKGETLYKSLAANTTKDFLNWCDNFLWKDVEEVSVNSFKRTCWNFYFNKTVERISLLKEKYDDIDFQSNYNINGIEVSNVSSLLEKINWDELCNGIPKRIHGDLQFDNVIKTGWQTYEREDFKLLDWREDFGGLVEYGDQYYDLAKLYGGLTLSYALVKENKFEIKEEGKDIKFNFESSHLLQEAINSFENFITEKEINLKKIKILRALIFLNMSPLHAAPFDRMLFFMGCYYLEMALNVSQ